MRRLVHSLDKLFTGPVAAVRVTQVVGVPIHGNLLRERPASEGPPLEALQAGAECVGDRGQWLIERDRPVEPQQPLNILLMPPAACRWFDKEAPDRVRRSPHDLIFQIFPKLLLDNTPTS